MSTIAFIPARCGSKSIPGKNIRPFFGKPLIYWSLKAAVDCPETNRVVVATDCDEIEKTVREFGLEKLQVYRRLPENARDTSSTESVMLEYIHKEKCNPDDRFILIQATSPFTESKHLEEAIKLMEKEKADSLISCAPFKRFIWTGDGVPINYDYRNRPRRQDFNDNFIENGAFYISKIRNIINSGNRLSGKISMYVMPEYSQLEMDEESDWITGEQLMAKHLYNLEIDFRAVKLFLSDIDGVLTDAGMYYSENGDELKKFNTHDGMGFGLLKKNKIKTGLITSENRELNRRRAEKLQMDYYFPGVQDKLSIVKRICEELGINLENVAYIGDDINDLEVLKNVGHPACPASAQEVIKTIPGIRILSRSGGNGAVREFINMIIKNGS